MLSSILLINNFLGFILSIIITIQNEDILYCFPAVICLLNFIYVVERS